MSQVWRTCQIKRSHSFRCTCWFQYRLSNVYTKSSKVVISGTSIVYYWEVNPLLFFAMNLFYSVLPTDHQLWPTSFNIALGILLGCRFHFHGNIECWFNSLVMWYTYVICINNPCYCFLYRVLPIFLLSSTCCFLSRPPVFYHPHQFVLLS